MLSYQHSYHAANLADVQKHALLCWTLAYMTRKDKPLSYIETHAGRGLYDLGGAEARKTGEAAKGFDAVTDWFDAGHPYRATVDALRAEYGPQSYPGSPALASRLLRGDDVLHFAELHSQEFAALQTAVPAAHSHQRDGLEFALAITPPTPRRGVCLIDPSYEVKTEYEHVAKTVAYLHRKWPVGVIMVWYPLLVGEVHDPMLQALEKTAPSALRHEVTFPPAREGHRMIGSGMFLINPPYGLEAEAKRLSAHFLTLHEAKT